MPSISNALSILSATNLFAQEVNRRENEKVRSKDDAILQAYRHRMLRHSLAVQQLASSELYDPMMAIIRLLLEEDFVHSVLRKNPDRLDELLRQDKAEAQKALNGVRDQVPESLWGTTINRGKLESEIRRYPKESGGFNVWQWADWAGSKADYYIAYRSASMYSHGAAGGAHMYLQGVNHTSATVRPSDSVPMCAEFLMIASSIILDSLTGRPQLIFTPEQIAQGEVLERRLSTLRRGGGVQARTDSP